MTLLYEAIYLNTQAKCFSLLQEEVLTLNTQPENHIFSCHQDNAVGETNTWFTSDMYRVVILAVAFAIKKAETPAFLNKSVIGPNVMCWI